MTNKKGDKRSHCLRPLELLKKPMGLPLTNTENLADEIIDVTI